jgi:hypothetical protein
MNRVRGLVAHITREAHWSIVDKRTRRGGRSSELTHSAAPWHESSSLCFAEDEEG